MCRCVITNVLPLLIISNDNFTLRCVLFIETFIVNIFGI